MGILSSNEFTHYHIRVNVINSKPCNEDLRLFLTNTLLVRIYIYTLKYKEQEMVVSSIVQSNMDL